MDMLLIAVIVTALAFDFTNGFHDAANAVATSISTRAVPPNVALAAAAILNVVGAVVVVAALDPAAEAYTRSARPRRGPAQYTPATKARSESIRVSPSTIEAMVSTSLSVVPRAVILARSVSSTMFQNSPTIAVTMLRSSVCQ